MLNFMQSAPDLIGTAEAAQIFGVAPSTITRWVQAKKLKPAYQLPGLILFDRETVLEKAAQ